MFRYVVASCCVLYSAAQPQNHRNYLVKAIKGNRRWGRLGGGHAPWVKGCRSATPRTAA
jgi:hypothetical protein